MMQACGLRASSGSLRCAGTRSSNALLPCLRSVATVARRPSRQGAVTVEARRSSSASWSPGGSTPGIVDRVLGALPYILPFFDAVMYGRYLFYLYPALKAAISPILPVMAAYHSVPFGGMIAFFGLYLGVVNNRSMSRFVRFNAVQAMLLDIILALPRLLETVFTPPTQGWGAQVYINSQSFVWIFITVWVVYGIINSMIGTYGRIPFIAEAADEQVR